MRLYHLAVDAHTQIGYGIELRGHVDQTPVYSKESKVTEQAKKDKEVRMRRIKIYRKLANKGIDLFTN